jgi:hypothetical protein
MRDSLDSGTTMSMPHDENFPFDLRPEEEACLRIILDYQQGRLNLEDAAPRLQAAFRANPRGLNLEMSPSIRRLFNEVAKLDGHPARFLGPDPERHADGGREFLERLIAQAWRDVSQHPRANEPITISILLAAATEKTALELVNWLETHGGHRVRLRTPTDADSDDWIINAHTPATLWTQDTVTRWARSLRAIPLAKEASFRGWSL